MLTCITGASLGTKLQTLKRSVRPAYPPRAQGLRGTVHPKAVVNTDGMVDTVALIRGVQSELDGATVDAVKRFAHAHGRTGANHVTLEMRFSAR